MYLLYTLLEYQGNTLKVLSDFWGPLLRMLGVYDTEGKLVQKGGEKARRGNRSSVSDHSLKRMI